MSVSKPLTSTEKSVLFRQRNAELGRIELRGVWATKDEQVLLKKLLREKLVELRKK